MSIATSTEQLMLSLHPDNIMCRKYQTVPLDTSAYVPAGDEFGLSQTDNSSAVFTASNGATIRVDVCTDRIMRIRVAPAAIEHLCSLTERLGLLNVPAVGATDVQTHTNPERAGIRAGMLSFEIGRSGDFVVADALGNPLVTTLDGGVRFSPETPDFSGNRFLSFFGLGDQHVYGFGGRTVPPDRTGTSADMFAVKAGSGHGDHGGFPIPFFLSTKGYGLFVNNPWPHVYFDMGKTIPGTWFLHSPGGEVDIFVIYGPEFPDIVRQFTAMVGRIPEPRRWWMGFWCSTISFSYARDMIETSKKFRNEGFPLEAVVADGPWRAGPEFIKQYNASHQYLANDINWHPDFGDGPAMIRDLSDVNVKTVLHLNSRTFKPDTVEEGVAKGWLRKQGDEVVLRVTDPGAEEWYRQLLDVRNKEGVGMWWLDHGDRISGEIGPGVPSRNLFGSLWARVVSQSVKDSVGEERLSLCRGGGIGSQRFALPWPGDTGFGIQYFGEDLWFAMNAGLCGFPITSADLGGFMPGGDPFSDEPTGEAQALSEDNICRRFVQSIFLLPNPRLHDAGMTKAKFPWNCPPSSRQLYKSMLDFRYSFTPYFFSYSLAAMRDGCPIVRPLVYHWRNDPQVYSISDQMMIGDWIMAAPVFTRGAATRSVYLPEGTWVDYWTEQVFEGPTTIEVEVPLYELRGLPLFVKNGAIIPTRVPCGSLADTITEELALDVYPSQSSEFVLHESASILHAFAVTQTADQLEVALPNHTATRRFYNVRIHQQGAIREIRCNGTELPRRQLTWDAARCVRTAGVWVEPLTEVVLTLDM